MRVNPFSSSMDLRSRAIMLVFPSVLRASPVKISAYEVSVGYLIAVLEVPKARLGNIGPFGDDCGPNG